MRLSRASATDTTDPADTSKLQPSPGMLLVSQVLVQKGRQEKLIAIQISLKAKAVWGQRRQVNKRQPLWAEHILGSQSGTGIGCFHSECG